MCFITHSKHNWKSSKGDKFLQAVTNLKQVEEESSEIHNNLKDSEAKPNFYNPWGLTFLNFEQVTC